MTTEHLEHPILFSKEMVRLILRGEKTQTRRVMKTQPGMVQKRDGHGVLPYPHCPYGDPGDILWVRQEFFGSRATEINPFSIWDEVTTMLRWSQDNKTVAGQAKKAQLLGGGLRKLPGMFLPRWASLLTLQVENVCMERLQEITETDARAEGFGDLDKPREAFAHVWDLLNGQRGATWESNPWVWVITFRVAQDLSKEAQP